MSDMIGKVFRPHYVNRAVGKKKYPINQQRNIPVFFNSRELLWDNVLQKIEAKKENLKKERIVSIKWWNGKTKLKTYKFGRPI